MVNIIGVNWGGHDPSACLVVDGKLIAAAEEERFVRVKSAWGFFPINAINFCLKYGKLTLDSIDYVAYAWGSPSFWLKENFRTFPHMLRSYNGVSLFSEFLVPFFHKVSTVRIKRQYFNGVRHSKFVHIPHHVAHAASAYRCSGFNEALTLVLDGAGEVASTSLFKAKDNSMKKIGECMEPNSLGYYYAMFTEYLGFKAFNDEYKVMGLAAYGKPRFDMSDILKKFNGTYHFNYGKYYAGFSKWYSEELVNKFGTPRKKDEPLTRYHKDLANSMQKTLEDVVIEMMEHALNNGAAQISRNLCLAGGVALNSKMNGRLLQSGFVDDIFIQPAANDAGTSIGAALELYSMLGYKSNFKLESMYLGPEFSDEEIEHLLFRRKIKYEHYGDIAGVCAELIAKGKVIGWFQERMEFGPRALGCRSILADPRDPTMTDKVNLFIKGRETFRPFAPSLLAESANEYLEDAYPSPFMILTFTVPEKKRKEIPAVVHVDGTVRPQTVKKEVNPLYYRLIKSFEEITGIPVVLNTSLNVKEEPIVCTPRDAIRCFFDSGLDYLAVGSYLITKENKS